MAITSLYEIFKGIYYNKIGYHAEKQITRTNNYGAAFPPENSDNNNIINLNGVITPGSYYYDGSRETYIVNNNNSSPFTGNKIKCGSTDFKLIVILPWGKESNSYPDYVQQIIITTGVNIYTRYRYKNTSGTVLWSVWRMVTQTDMPNS